MQDNGQPDFTHPSPEGFLFPSQGEPGEGHPTSDTLSAGTVGEWTVAMKALPTGGPTNRPYEASSPPGNETRWGRCPTVLLESYSCVTIQSFGDGLHHACIRHSIEDNFALEFSLKWVKSDIGVRTTI